jgi:hypothetical protein
MGRLIQNENTSLLSKEMFIQKFLETLEDYIIQMKEGFPELTLDDLEYKRLYDQYCLIRYQIYLEENKFP